MPEGSPARFTARFGAVSSLSIVLREADGSLPGRQGFQQVARGRVAALAPGVQQAANPGAIGRFLLRREQDSLLRARLWQGSRTHPVEKLQGSGYVLGRP